MTIFVMYLPENGIYFLCYKCVVLSFICRSLMLLTEYPSMHVSDERFKNEGSWKI